MSTLFIGPSASAVAPQVTGCGLYHDGSGANIYVNQFLGQAIDDVQAHYQILIDGQAYGVTFARTYSSTIPVSFAGRVLATSQSASIVYTRTTSGGLQNGSGEYLEDFTCALSPSNVGPSAVSSATNAAGSEITITTDQDIDAGDSFVRSASSWDLDTGHSTIAISSVAVSGRQVTLTLSGSVQHTDSLQLSFQGSPPEEPMPVRYFWTTNYRVPVTNNVPAPVAPTPVVQTPNNPAPVVPVETDTTLEVSPVAQAGTTSIKRVGNTVRMFVLDPAGLGKVQFKINGREIAWVRAVEATDPKLRQANGRTYFVRNAALSKGKNAIEVYVDGKRVKRVSHTR